jgi:hypothetical protein
MLPPLIIQEAQVEEILEKTERAFKKLAFYRAAYTVKKMIGKLPF